MVGIALIGYGYWGANLARNFSAVENCRLVSICEKRKDRAAKASQLFPGTLATDDYDLILNDPGVAAIVISTPVSAHFELAKRALSAGKDVLVEKPLVKTSAEAEELIRMAEKNGRILAVDHTYLYSGAVRKIKEIVDSGELGGIMYIDSVRVNLGLFQPDVNVIYDLAPHDISIANHLLGKEPVSVQALGTTHGGGGFEYLSYMHLDYGDGVIAHFHLNWLSPIKIRRTLIAGSNKMIVYDDTEQSEKVKIYDRGVTIKEGGADPALETNVDYRMGDMDAPKIDNREALAVEAAHFVSCVEKRTPPLADGRSALGVTRIIEAAQNSINNGGIRIEMSKL
jgi:predicted dehydrogenase